MSGCQKLVADLTAALDWYDGEASAHLPDDVRGRTLADSVRAALIDDSDRVRAAFGDLAGKLRGPFLSLPSGFKSEPLNPVPVRLAELTATILGGAVGGMTGLESLTDKQIKTAVNKAARLSELAAAHNGSGPPPAPTPPDRDSATAFLEWFVARGGRAEYGERPQLMTDAQAGDARRCLLKRGVVAYGKDGTLELTAEGRTLADGLFRPVMVNGGPHVGEVIKLAEQDDAA